MVLMLLLTQSYLELQRYRGEGWYRGVKLDLKTANASDSAAIQARERAQIRCDVKVDFVTGNTGNKTLSIRKVVFPGYGYRVDDIDFIVDKIDLFNRYDLGISSYK